MRQKRRRAGYSIRERRWLFGATAALVAVMLTVNCSFEDSLASLNEVVPAAAAGELAAEPIVQKETDAVPEMIPLAEGIDGDSWTGHSDDNRVTAPGTTSTMSIDVVDANLLDVLSLIAYKLNVNIIFLEQPTTITFKSVSLSPITTFQTILQKEGLDYITLGRNYIVGNRGRLYGDFFNRIMLTRYDLFYVSPTAMEGYISQLGVDVQSLTVDGNQQSLWIQGTPITLGKARELMNSLDIMENAAFAEGGARKIRMPVAMASGSRANEELIALVDLLSILLDGYRDGRTDMEWVTWDHPDPFPSIIMDWDSPIIKPYDVMMKITRDFTGDPDNQVRYLIAEGTAANIDLVEQMIAAISGTPASPFSFPEIADIESFAPIDAQGGGFDFQYTPPSVQYEMYTISLQAVPASGGSLGGAGEYSEGSTVTVTATPEEGYLFVRWIENGVEWSTSKSYTFTASSNRNLEAVFLNDSDNTDADENDLTDDEEEPGE